MKEFATYNDYTAYINGSPVLPNVSTCFDRAGVAFFKPEPEGPVLPPNNEIWYTSTDGNVIELENAGKRWEINNFGGIIVSNTYENGRGIVRFDGNITKVTSPFSIIEQFKITSIAFPDSVTSIKEYSFNSCSHLQEIVIPPNIINVGKRVFCVSANVWVMELPEKNFINFSTKSAADFNVTVIPDGKWVNNFLIQNNTLIRVCGEGGDSITIPDNVISVQNDAFHELYGFPHTLNIYVSTKILADYLHYTYMENYGGGGAVRKIYLNGQYYGDVQHISCFLPDTQITLADYTTKAIKDITYDDDILVWNADEGKLDSAKPVWLTHSGLMNDHYYKLTFSDGSVLKVTGQNSNHKMYDMTKREFAGCAYAEIGDVIYSLNGPVTLTGKEYIEEEIEYYNIQTDQHINCFAEGILTSDRYGNLYPHDENMKYVKDDREIRPYEEFEAAGISRYWYDHLRMGESTESVEKAADYVKKCESQMLPLPDAAN